MSTLPPRRMLDVVYGLGLVGASPWLAYKALTTGKYRAGWRQKLGGVPRRDPVRPCLWIHAVSVGEILATRTVVDLLRREFADWDFVFSTTTNTGFEVASRTYADDTVIYYPLDFSGAVEAALEGIRPSVVALFETELWLNFMNTCHRRHIPIVVANGRLSERSARGYRRLRFLYREPMGELAAVAAQTDEHADRFHIMGVPRERITVAGNVKYDAVETERHNPRTDELRHLLGLRDGDPVFIAGSTMTGEEEAALRVWGELKQEHDGLRLIIVPRHQERFDEVARLIEATGAPLARRTQLATNDTAPSDAVVLIDTLGELVHVWGLADLAFVGGSLYPRGGQNMIEPAGYGAAVVFGPNTFNFKQTVDDLLSRAAARVVQNETDLLHTCRDLLAHPAQARAMGARARDFVLTQAGASQRNADVLAPVMRAVISNL